MTIEIHDKEKASANKLWMLNASDVLYFIDDIRRIKKNCCPRDRSCSHCVMII